jgi:dolichol kinase
VTIRTRSIWRRPEGRLFGVIVMIVGAVLVWLFWPVWLVIAGISLVRRRKSTTSLVAR